MSRYRRKGRTSRTLVTRASFEKKFAPKKNKRVGSFKVMTGEDKGSAGEVGLDMQLRGSGEGGRFVREYQFHPYREYRSDFAFIEERLLIEIQGGGHVRGAHHNAKGYAYDCERMCEAVGLGYVVMYVTPEQVKSGEACTWVLKALQTIRTNEKDTP